MVLNSLEQNELLTVVALLSNEKFVRPLGLNQEGTPLARGDRTRSGGDPPKPGESPSFGKTSLSG